MTTTMSIRELTRNGSRLEEYDYIDIEDKKRKEYKGVFISSRYADEVKRFLEKKIDEEKQRKIDSIMKYAGSMNGDSSNMSSQEIKASKIKKYYNE